jgi:hypothetical protein
MRTTTVADGGCGALQAALHRLQGLGLVDEITGRRRNRFYRYTRYLDILDEGTEPLPR